MLILLALWLLCFIREETVQQRTNVSSSSIRCVFAPFRTILWVVRSLFMRPWKQNCFSLPQPPGGRLRQFNSIMDVLPPPCLKGKKITTLSVRHHKRLDSIWSKRRALCLKSPRVLSSHPCRSKYVHTAVHLGATADLRLLVHSFYQLKRADRRLLLLPLRPPRAVRSLTGVKVITVIEKRSLRSIKTPKERT